LRGYVGRDGGYILDVLRVVSVLALVVFLAAGCGGAARSPTIAAHGVPRALASEWAGRTSAIAVAAKAGNSCRALQLASSLRDDVIASEAKVPSRLRSPLVTGVNALAARFTCTPKPTAPANGPKHPNPPKPPKQHDHHGQGDEKGKHR
jgi:hypothetical protein